jgi:uncharacterized protein (DUF488 family)
MELFTIGYEGTSLKAFLHSLKTNRIQILCDVRSNPFSRKKGFSKKSLKSACEQDNIEYRHYPMLGIATDMRKNLRSSEDYQELFTFYRKHILPANTDKIQEIFDTIQRPTNIALMCFEKDPATCHRSRLADVLTKMGKGSLSVKHLYP